MGRSLAEAATSGTSGSRAMKVPLLKQLMTPFPYSVALDATLTEARELLETHRLHHLPVVQEHRPVGLITDREITRGLAASGRHENPVTLLVRDVYVPDSCVVDINAPLEGVLQAMSERHVDAVIVTRKDRLSGVLTSMDVCRYFAAYLRENFPRPGGSEPA
jgi:acetoin utilization protein AcuB